MAKEIRFIDAEEKLPERNIRSIDYPEGENVGYSLMAAVPRMGEDLVKSLYGAVKSVPEYYREAKTEVPGLFEQLKNDPKRLLGQMAGGGVQLGEKTFNTPHDMANYATQRLHLFPEGLNEKIQMGRMPDRTEAINEVAGFPSQPGDKLARGITRNANLELGGAGLIKAANPLALRKTSIARDILDTAQNNMENYRGQYRSLWNDAQQSGHNNMANASTNVNFRNIFRFSDPESVTNINRFRINPTVENAHDALKDLKKMQRELKNEKSLNSHAQSKLNAISDAIPQIQDNMFMDANGVINQELVDRYHGINQGYARDVIPYTTNTSIKAYNKPNPELTLPDLYDELASNKKFKAQVGSRHPRMKARKVLGYGSAIGSGVAGADYLISKLLGQSSNHDEE